MWSSAVFYSGIYKYTNKDRLHINSGFVINGKTNLSKEYLARLQLLEPYLRVETIITEKSNVIISK